MRIDLGRGAGNSESHNSFLKAILKSTKAFAVNEIKKSTI